MKLLIGYDGSGPADMAIRDLANAGLPADTEALVLSVAEMWMPAPAIANGPKIQKRNTDASTDKDLPDPVIPQSMGEVVTLSAHAAKNLETLFPDWHVTASAKSGSPAKEILKAADYYDPDLIVVGSQGRTAVGRLLLGSISQKVLAEARCSVRIGRSRKYEDTGQLNIVIGFDGSNGSNAAVEVVAGRRWSRPCSIHLVTASSALVPTAIGRFIPPVVSWIEDELKTEKEWIETLAERAFVTLKATGCGPNLRVRSGNPKQVIIEEAERLGAHTIFLGAHSDSSELERFLIGSTSSAVAARAGCTVEVVRAHS